MTDREVMQQALEALTIYSDAQCSLKGRNAITALRTALEQPPLPVQEPVSMRMPKVGDKVICLEDESLGTVESLTAGGSPDITFEDGTRGTYLLREFAELFGYVAAPQQQAEPPPEWLLIKNILDEYGLDAIAFVAAWKAVQQQAKPVAREGFERWAKSLPNYIDLSRFEDGYSDCNTDYAWAGWQAAKRPWVGLTNEEIADCAEKMEASDPTDSFWREFFRGIEAKLKEKNDH